MRYVPITMKINALLISVKTSRVKSVDRHTRDPFIAARDLNARRYLVDGDR